MFLSETKYQNIFKMKKLALIFVIAGLFVNLSCGLSENKNGEKIVQIETEFGAIKIKLYNETPLHRDNFIKLTKDGVYTDLLFHRIILGFMIQGGDPDSKNAEPGKYLGSGDLGYTIPAEINPKFFHRRGILAAARQGDDINPEKRSSASQFYILQGKVFRPDELDTLQLKLEESRKLKIMQVRIKSVEPELNKLGAEGKQDELMARYNALKEEVSAEAAQLPPIKFSEEQRKAYTTVGGYPSLDNNYTVFGEVTEGMGVVDNIARQLADKFDRPLKDIKFRITMIK
jgi:cyclophilin family peptidyl-prolyl cis-trans isomerase